MAEIPKLTHPWLVAVWPGMGHVALNAGIYLLSKMGMNAVAEFEAGDLFDVDQIYVRNGLIQPVRRPRNRFFVWHDPARRHDLVVFIGEAQPPLGKFAFCRQVIAFAKQLGVERVFTFAAMATRMRPQDKARVFGAATDAEGVAELKQLELELIEDGNIGGLNGVLLAAAAEAGLRGTCLLGEMPHVFAQAPYPRASSVILRQFAIITGIEIDLEELDNQARMVEEQLTDLWNRFEEQYSGTSRSEEDESPATEEETDEPAGYQAPEADEEPGLPSDRERIEELFRQAATDRSKAFELKRELDRLGWFKRYEDRFLDLFKKPRQ